MLDREVEMQEEQFYSVAERCEAKRRGREQDEARLRNGEISAAELNERNGFFSKLDRASARVVSWRSRVKLGDSDR